MELNDNCALTLAKSCQQLIRFSLIPSIYYKLNRSLTADADDGDLLIKLLVVL